MNIIGYIGIVSVIMQVMFFIIMFILYKQGYDFNDLTIWLLRIVAAGVIMSIVIVAVIAYTHKPKKVVLLKPLLSQAQLEQIVIGQAIHYKVPLSIAKSLVYQESRWNPRAVSSCQASGLCQIMPSTWVAYTDKEDIFNPTSNAEVGMHYLSDLYYKKHKNWQVALGIYNAGSNYRCREARMYVAEVLSRVEYK